MFVMRYFGHEHHVCGIGKRPSNLEAIEAKHPARVDRTNANDRAGLGRREFIVTGSALTAASLVPGIAAPAATTDRKANSMTKVLVINAHQLHLGISEGRLNRNAGLIREEMGKKGREVRETNTDQAYTPDEEVQKHLWADIIVTRSPVFWFGTPWIYRIAINGDEIGTIGPGLSDRKGGREQVRINAVHQNC
jgi:modulator of drug activity B